MNHTAAIVGLGRIGMLYDKGLPMDGHVLSHARAFLLHPDFQLVAGVDPHPVLRGEFAREFSAPAYGGIDELLAEKRPDVIVVACPTELHGETIAQILDRHRPRAILCEKPLAEDAASAAAVAENCSRLGVSLFVNFIRRADPGVGEVRSRIASGSIAMPFKAVVWYSKGLVHNGSHFADLLSFWFGPIRALRIVDPGRAVGEFDAEPDIRVDFEHGSAIFCAAVEENYSHYTVEVVASNGRLRYEQGGAISWQPATAHPVLAGYRQLDPIPETIGNDMNRYQYHVVEQLGRALRGQDHSLCTGDRAAITQRWLEGAITERALCERNHG